MSEEINNLVSTEVKNDISENDPKLEEQDNESCKDNKIGNITFVRCAVGQASGPTTPSQSPSPDHKSQQTGGGDSESCDVLFAVFYLRICFPDGC